MPPKLLEKPVVLVDDSCRFCVTATDQLRAMDKDGALEWANLHDETTRKRFKGINWTRAEEEVHLIHRDGRVTTGARAVRDIADHIGGELGAAAAELMDKPGVREASELIYKLISNNRFKISEAMERAATAHTAKKTDGE